MDPGGGSFRVHLQSLKDFAQRLQEQLEVVQRSTRSAAVLNRPPDLPLGAFAEAFALSDDHSDAVRQSEVVLEKVARSIDFARSVTELVAQRYEALNSAGARGIGGVGAALPVPPNPLLPTVQPAPLYAPPPAYPAQGYAPAPAGYTPAPAYAPPVSALPAQPVTGSVAPPAGSLAPPEVIARFTVPVPPDGGTVYYYNGSTTQPVRVTVEAQDS
jgi:hypothetical protein